MQEGRRGAWHGSAWPLHNTASMLQGMAKPTMPGALDGPLQASGLLIVIVDDGYLICPLGYQQAHDLCHCLLGVRPCGVVQ